MLHLPTTTLLSLSISMDKYPPNYYLWIWIALLAIKINNSRPGSSPGNGPATLFAISVNVFLCSPPPPPHSCAMIVPRNYRTNKNNCPEHSCMAPVWSGDSITFEKGTTIEDRHQKQLLRRIAPLHIAVVAELLSGIRWVRSSHNIWRLHNSQLGALHFSFYSFLVVIGWSQVLCSRQPS